MRFQHFCCILRSCGAGDDLCHVQLAHFVWKAHAPDMYSQVWSRLTSPARAALPAPHQVEDDLWTATGLEVMRVAMPQLRGLLLINAMQHCQAAHTAHPVFQELCCSPKLESNKWLPNHDLTCGSMLLLLEPLGVYMVILTTTCSNHIGHLLPAFPAAQSSATTTTTLAPTF